MSRVFDPIRCVVCIAGKIPASLGQLTNLTWLELGDNKFTGSATSAFFFFLLIFLKKWSVLHSKTNGTGELPLSVVSLFSYFCYQDHKAKGSSVFIVDSDECLGYTLPANMGDLYPTISFLDLRSCGLGGS